MHLERITNSAVEPKKATQHSACYDICADANVTLEPGERALIPTGWKMCCNPGFRIAMYPRSGLAVRQGVTLINAVGVIDADYREEVKIPLINLGNETVTIERGMRVAQIALEELAPTTLHIGTLPPTLSDRLGGFGSTGL